MMVSNTLLHLFLLLIIIIGQLLGLLFKENTYVINRSGKTIDIKNSVERVYSETIIDHNIMAKDTFINIGGIKTILPTLHKIAYRNPTSEFAYC